MKPSFLFMNVLFFCFLLSGCITNFNSLESGQSVPENRTLLVAKFQFEPEVKQDNLPIYVGSNARKRGEVYFLMFPDRNEPYKKGSMFPLSPKNSSSMNVSFLETSFTPLTPGTKFIRFGNVDTDMGGTYNGRTATTTIYTINLMGDLELDIPSEAKAVYAGTITWHYLTGEITVKDEFKSAIKDLQAANIPGLTSKDLIKRLAKSYKPNIQ